MIRTAGRDYKSEEAKAFNVDQYGLLRDKFTLPNTFTLSANGTTNLVDITDYDMVGVRVIGSGFDGIFSFRNDGNTLKAKGSPDKTKSDNIFLDTHSYIDTRGLKGFLQARVASYISGSVNIEITLIRNSITQESKNYSFGVIPSGANRFEMDITNENYVSLFFSGEITSGNVTITGILKGNTTETNVENIININTHVFLTNNRIPTNGGSFIVDASLYSSIRVETGSTYTGSIQGGAIVFKSPTQPYIYTLLNEGKKRQNIFEIGELNQSILPGTPISLTIDDAFKYYYYFIVIEKPLSDLEITVSHRNTGAANSFRQPLSINEDNTTDWLEIKGSILSFIVKNLSESPEDVNLKIFGVL